MGRLDYSILRYRSSFVSGEAINLAAIFCFQTPPQREFFHIKNWSRVSAFDDSVSIPMLKDVMLDMEDEVGTVISYPEFVLQDYIVKYHSELYFEKMMSLDDVYEFEIDQEIENIKRMYFPSEYKKEERPKYEDQKKFLNRILKAKQVKYERDSKEIGRYQEEIRYDYKFNEFGVKFFNLNDKKANGQTLQSVKAWAWNCNNEPEGLKTIILYDLADDEKNAAAPILGILESAKPYKLINVHEGFNAFEALFNNNT